MGDYWDLFLLFICACSNGFYFSYSFFISYQISYIKHFYLYPISEIYSTVIALDIGLILSGFIYFRIINIIGINNGFRLYSFLVAIAMGMFIYLPHIIPTTIAYFIMGFSHQLNSMNINYCLNMKYKSKLVQYTGYVFTGTSVSCILWGVLSVILVNPGNVPKTMSQVLESGEVERYFDFSVAGNMSTFFFVYSLVNIVCPVFTSICFKLDKEISELSDQKSVEEKFPMLQRSVFMGRIVGGVGKSFYQSVISKSFFGGVIL
jgi:hypothetical protein